MDIRAEALMWRLVTTMSAAFGLLLASGCTSDAATFEPDATPPSLESLISLPPQVTIFSRVAYDEPQRMEGMSVRSQLPASEFIDSIRRELVSKGFSETPGLIRKDPDSRDDLSTSFVRGSSLLHILVVSDTYITLRFFPNTGR